ncbi:MAG: phage portal protein [Lachnospiraceae bacterium]|nr:phage portal protein [Lachnospiraceae bacterium]
MSFVRGAISTHMTTEVWKTAVYAEEYFCRRNVTINAYQKILYTITGQAVPDNYSANWKMASGFFRRFVTQEVQYLLANGVMWQEDSTGDALGKGFDTTLQEAAKEALKGGVSFGFWNLDHLEVFSVREFVPLYDEENSALMAGIRFWQIDSSKPLRATLYEIDGYTDYIWREGEDGAVLKEKRPYVVKLRTSEVDGTEIYDFENYPSFPIVPLWGNESHQSELVGLREQIDCYDLIKSGFANDIDDASLIYWTIQNGGGMDDVDLAKFVERMHVLKAAVVEDSGATAEAHTMDIPYASREALLDRLSKDLYRDAMALDTSAIAGGAVTATEIEAAYEPLNSKCDDFEYCVHKFLDKILVLAGIENENATFTRSKIVNAQEELQSVVSAAPYLDEEYVTKKVLHLLGDGDQAGAVLDAMYEAERERTDFGSNSGETEQAGESSGEEENAQEG